MQDSIFSFHNRLIFLRVLILSEFVTILVSTSLAIIIEFLIYLTILSSRDLLKKLYAIRHEPMIRMTVVWILVLAASCLYTIATRQDLIDILSSWRKLLLLPICAAYFTDPVWKKRAILTFFIAICALLAISSLTWALDISFSKYQNGIIIANHAAQGMSFSVCLILALTVANMYRSQPAKRILCFMAAAIAFLNIVFVTPGRSGYLAMISILSIYIFFSISGVKKYLIFLGLILAIALTFNFSNVAKERINLGISEIKSYQTSKQLTSMGARMVAWQNSLKLIQERPVFGYGSAAFVEAYKKTIVGESGWQGEVIEDPHNQFLRILVEHGIVGLLIFLLFIGSFFLQPAQNPFRILGLSVLLTWCATSLFSSHFTTFLEGRFLMIWLGIFLSSVANPENLNGGPSCAVTG